MNSPLMVIIVVYNLPNGVKQGCIKWTFHANCYIQECMINHKNPESWSYNMLLVFQEIHPAHWVVSILMSSFGGCWLLMNMLWKCKHKQISGQTYVKAYKILEIMTCNRRKTSMLSQHSAMNYSKPEANQGHTGAE